MNRNALKSYAPKARRDFIAAVTARAAKLGVTAEGVDPISLEGDFAIIGGTPFPKKVAAQRELLERRIRLLGFSRVMESAAYTWFNRFAAIRYMEIHGYFDHGYRVLSHPKGEPTPEILQHAEQVELPGLKRAAVLAFKLDGRKDEELFRMILSAQCNALHATMPFLFERIDDETELLLPDNLLHTDSVVRQMISQTDENDWEEIEIIGWLYQYYIADRKDEVIGKVVKSEDIPAATQLFTPSWIVKYLVQNSLGAKWLATYPNSPLRAKMEYYIEPARQSSEVREALLSEMPAEIDPETIKMIDPACGSGHILVEGYDLLKEIYLERGYVLRQIPKLILEKNIFGLDIDDRAAQLAGFALMMKARADDPKILSLGESLRLNVIAIQESREIESEAIVTALTSRRRAALVPADDLLPETLTQPVLTMREAPPQAIKSVIELLEIFTDGKTFGSLIEIPDSLAASLVDIQDLLAGNSGGDIFEISAYAWACSVIGPLAQQALILSGRYDVVVANPPYMGEKYFDPKFKPFIKKNWEGKHPDLYSLFVSRGLGLAKNGAGVIAFITLPNWLFLVGFEEFRKQVINSSHFLSLIHLGRGAFGSDFGSCAFVLRELSVPKYASKFRRLFDRAGSVASVDELRDRFLTVVDFTMTMEDFSAIPGSPIAYWGAKHLREIFSENPPLGQLSDVRQGMATTDNNRFLRLWHELNLSRIAFGSADAVSANRDGKDWFPFNKGGDFRRWYGNFSFVVNYERNGESLIELVTAKYPRISDPEFVIKNRKYYFRESITWSDITISQNAFRYCPPGFIFDVCAPSAFFSQRSAMLRSMAFLNSKVCTYLTGLLNPTVHFTLGDFKRLPFRDVAGENCVEECISIAKEDWDSFETSWDFEEFPIVKFASTPGRMMDAFDQWGARCAENLARIKELEEQNNRNFIQAYGLENEMKAEIKEDEITLARSEKGEDVRRLISYSIGCMMGRFSLVEPGVVYAGSGNQGFDPNRYGSFSPDTDGIIPMVDGDWFSDDVSNRFVIWLKCVWGAERLEENLRFCAGAIGERSGETPLDTVRRYLSRDFFKDHLQVYKRRPIYWLFSSGKEKAFECLVYLHRYHPGTLSRMRMEYVVPLQSRMRGKIEQIDSAIKVASTSAAQTKLRKELERLKKKQTELVKFDEELRHFADLRPQLDLDDGVKVNYAKFGNLLAEVKKIAGGTDE
ncbi:BREX-1 system adenine-specific DNA-methyltransferase PglX [Tardiphaga sp. 71_E8_N1_1]|uniref:BREX-1 system adenine-specific DNA-methyltransferase PglX n=1 Tax=Tardiphaga sp. 71_E8_N1_1 TaxID=3240784 RepID=UPI003F8A05EA